MPRTVSSTQVKLLALLTAIGLACGAYSCNTGPVDNNGTPNPTPTIQGSNLDAPPPPNDPAGDEMVDCTITVTPENPCISSSGNTACVPDTGPATYEWTITGGSITDGQGTRCITFTAEAGTVVLTVSGADVPAAEGCNCEGEITLNPSDTPIDCEITVEPPCPNSTGNTASISDPGAGAVILWQIQGGTITAGQGTDTVTFTAGASGDVKIFVSVTVNGCTALCKDEVPILEGPECDITGEAPCPDSTGNTASIANPGAGATIVWAISGGTITGGQGTPTLTYTAGASGVVGLDVTVTLNGCECTDSLDLTILAEPNCTITAADVCPNSTGNTASIANPGAGATIVWTISGGSITAGQGTASITFSAGASGTVALDVTVTNAAGCECTGSLDVDITSNLSCVIAEPTVGGVFTGTITGGDAPFSCSADIDVAGWVVDSCVVNNAGNGPGFTVNYHRTDGACDPISPPLLTVTITDDSGCETECSAGIPCPPGGCVITGGGLICQGDTATLCVEPATGTLPPVTISWTGPNGYTASTDCITVSVPGVYTATVTDGNGFESVCCAPVGVLKLKGTLSPCANSTDLVFSAHVDASGQATFSGTYEWSISGNGTFCDGTTTADGNPVCIDAGAAGSFVLSVTVTGTLNFTCDGTATSEPVVETCVLNVPVVSCP